MMKSFSLSMAAVILIAAIPVLAQDAPFEGQVRAQAVGSGALMPQMKAAASAALRSSDIAWVGYEFTVREHFRDIIVGGLNGRFSGTFINGVGIPSHRNDGITRIGSPTRVVLHMYRAGAGGKPQLDKITFMDPSERTRFTKPLIWFTGVDARRSIDAHVEIVKSTGKFDDRGEAIAMLALHDNDAGLSVLREFFLSDRDEDDREDALLWYGFALLPDRYDELKGLEKQVKGEDVREELTGIYYRAGNEDAIKRLFSMARTDESEDVREEAVTRLGYLASRRIAAEMGVDPHEDKVDEEDKHAVYVLSRMESERSRETLVKLVHTGKNYGIRKTALYWLTREEPNAQVISLLEELLRK